VFPEPTIVLHARDAYVYHLVTL